MISRKFCLLVNAMAGNGRALQVLKNVENTLSNLSVNFRTVITENIAHAQNTAKQAITQGECIAILGGDGSARALIATIVETQGVLAFIPAGRGNDLARTLNLPLDPLSACQVLARGKEIVVDIAEVNKNPFLSICSLGFDSIANQIANNTRIIKGRFVYIYAGLRALWNWKPATFKVTIDGMEFEHTGYTVAVANSKYYGGGMKLAPNACLCDGLLDVVLIGEISKLRMLVNIPRIYKGTHIHEPGFKIIRGHKIKIEADPRFMIFADGDPITQPPADINILPNKLRILVTQNESKV